MESDPSGIGNDRAVIEQFDAGKAVLAVGPGRMPVHLAADELPSGVDVGTWLVLDLQSQPPLVIGVDEELTRRRAGS